MIEQTRYPCGGPQCMCGIFATHYLILKSAPINTRCFAIEEVSKSGILYYSIFVNVIIIPIYYKK